MFIDGLVIAVLWLAVAFMYGSIAVSLLKRIPLVIRNSKLTFRVAVVQSMYQDYARDTTAMAELCNIHQVAHNVKVAKVVDEIRIRASAHLVAVALFLLASVISLFSSNLLFAVTPTASQYLYFSTFGAAILGGLAVWLLHLKVGKRVTISVCEQQNMVLPGSFSYTNEEQFPNLVDSVNGRPTQDFSMAELQALIGQLEFQPDGAVRLGVHTT